MKQGSKISTYHILTIVSLVALLSFLVYWNIQNYTSAKEDLVYNLEQELALSKAKLKEVQYKVMFSIFVEEGHLDSSLLFQSGIVKPELLDFESIHISTSLDKGDHLPSRLELNRVTISSDSNFGNLPSTVPKPMILRSSNDTVEMALSESITERFNIDSNLKDMVLINKTNPLQNEITLDSLYRRRLNKVDLPTNFYFSDKQDIPPSNHELLVESNSLEFGYRGLTAIFKNYRLYIFKRILPPLVGSILLFGLLATSLILILRNWLAQQKMNQIKNEFISNMTHELKTPIATVGVAIEAMEHFGVNDNKEKRKEYLEICKKELTRLTTLTNKVIGLSFNDKSNIDFSFEELDIKELVVQALESMKIIFEQGHHQVNFESSADDFHINGDPLHLNNVLFNLLDNAAKYSKDQSRIDISLSSKKNEIELIIKDNGIGIDKNDQKKIFDRFYRVPNDDRHNIKGHGLGLHYVKNIINRHKGRISVESKINQGATFIINLPRHL